MMKQNSAIFALGAIVLIGLSSCSTNTNAPSSSTATAETSDAQALIKAGGSSSTIDFLRILKTAYESNSDAELQAGQMSLLEPGQSENMIMGVKQGLIDVGAISRTLKPGEDDGSLEFRAVAQDGLLVAVHPSVTGVKNLTTANLKAIYSGNVTNWQQLGGPDAAIVLLDRPEDESAKRLLRQHYLGKDLQNAPKAIVLRKEGELIQTIQSTPYSIGAFSLAYAISHRLPVHRLSLNEIEPTSENLKTGQYLMSRTIGIIWNKNASEPTQSLVRYALSQPGAKILEQSGFVSLTPAKASAQ
jgi:phosphate transport system substrate-binding protein